MLKNAKYAIVGLTLLGLNGCSYEAVTAPTVGQKPAYSGDQNPDTQTPGTQTPGAQTPGGETPVDGGAVDPGNVAGAALAEIKDVQILDLIKDDVSKLNPTDAQKTRYFSLHVASNSGLTDAGLEAQRAAFRKSINSISAKPAVFKPVAIDADKIVYRVNLDDIGLSPATFDQVIADHYPFNRRFEDVGSAESISNEDNDASLRKLLQTDIYLIRMDWWNSTAMLPILYDKFMAFPENLSDFEDQFLGRRVSVASLSADARRNLDGSLVVREAGVNKVDLRIANILNNNVVRTGFDNSNVSFSNRIVERHEGKTGGYYISYDFFNLKLGDNFVNAQGQARVANQLDLDEHNINKSPLGPKGTNASDRGLEFNHDGGEVIFMMPNGLFGFYLINAKGTLLDKGPINVVRQNTAPAEFSLAITNGQSCMSCHNAGLLKQADTILQGIGVNKNDLLQADIARINKIYQADSHVAKLDRDNQTFFSALQQIGIDPTKPDPIDQTFRFYNRPLQKKDVVAELGLSDRDFSLLLVDPEFSGIFNALNNETGFINRAVFQAIYPKVIAKFKQDISLIAPEKADFVVNADCMDDDAVQMDTCIIQPQQ